MRCFHRLIPLFQDRSVALRTQVRVYVNNKSGSADLWPSAPPCPRSGAFACRHVTSLSSIGNTTGASQLSRREKTREQRHLCSWQVFYTYLQTPFHSTFCAPTSFDNLYLSFSCLCLPGFHLTFLASLEEHWRRYDWVNTCFLNQVGGQMLASEMRVNLPKDHMLARRRQCYWRRARLAITTCQMWPKTAGILEDSGHLGWGFLFLRAWVSPTSTQDCTAANQCQLTCYRPSNIWECLAGWHV